MARDQIRARQSFFVPVAQAAQGYATACWQPPVDVYQTADGWLVKYDLAGVRPDEIQLSAQGRRLIARALGCKRGTHRSTVGTSMIERPAPSLAISVLARALLRHETSSKPARSLLSVHS